MIIRLIVKIDYHNIFFKTAQNGKRKFVLFVFASWLTSRLWLGFELSKLVMLRSAPKPEIQQVTKTFAKLPASRWINNNQRLICLCEESEKNRVIIIVLPKFQTN